MVRQHRQHGWARLDLKLTACVVVDTGRMVEFFFVNLLKNVYFLTQMNTPPEHPEYSNLGTLPLVIELFRILNVSFHFD